MSHTLVALVQDRPGVLHRTVSLFRRRGFNIASLAVGHSETPGVSRLTLVVDADDVEQVVKQLYRLIEVLKVVDVTREPTVERETVLAKVHAPSGARPAVVAVVNAFDARTTDVGASTMIVEMTGTPARVESFIQVLRPFGIRELTRSGRLAMVRGGRGRFAAPRAAAGTASRDGWPAGAVAEMATWPDAATSQADGVA